MRIVAGRWRGRTIKAPAGDAVRPTADRVREAWMSIVGTALPGARVLDLFAGSGALGIEALSRGASSAVFVDVSPGPLECVRANLETTGLDGQIVRMDAHRYDDGPFDLALLDPPYATTDEQWRALLTHIDAHVVVVESDREIVLGDRWELLRSKRYGSTVVQIGRRTEHS